MTLLFQRIAGEDGVALAEAWRLRNDALNRTAARVLGRADVAEEVVQEAWIRIVALLQDGELAPEVADAALRRTVVRGAMDTLRRRRRRDALLSLFSPGLERSTASTADPLLASALGRAIDRLPEAQRVPLLLRELDGWTSGEIATALELTVDAVDQRISRARRALRSTLERRGVEPVTPPSTVRVTGDEP